MPVQLDEPILDGGFKFVHFFEGRILTGRDLRDQALADREERRQLGRGVGAGVASGLEVEIVNRGQTGAIPILRVTPGVAINREGEPLVLSQPQQVELARSEDEKDGSKDIFDLCNTQPSNLQIPNGIGFYVLVIAPASGFQGEAPKSGLGDQGVAAGCGKRYATLGVQFRLVRLDPLSVSGVDEAAKAEIAALAVSSATAPQSLLRNILAHICLGTPETSAFPLDPFALEEGASQFLHYGALDDLRTAGSLLDCDVPLALFSWTNAGLGFLDMWAARRRVARDHVANEWPLVAADRRRAEAEASFFQFERQLNDLLHNSDTDPESMQARHFFRYLPAAGMLRIANAAHDGFSAAHFYQGVNANGPHDLAGPRVLPLLDVSHLHRPIDLSVDDALLFRYEVIENQEDATARQYEVFTSGWVPFQGDPEFELDAVDAIEDLQEDVDALAEAQPQATGNISGRVSDASGGVLPGASVTAEREGGPSLSTIADEQGNYLFANLQAGTYEVGVEFAGFSATSETVDVPPDQDVDFTLGAGQESTVDVRGTVKDKKGSPVTGAQVTLFNKTTLQSRKAKTLKAGTFKFTNVVAGPYKVTAAKKGHANGVANVLLGKNQLNVLEISLA